MLLYFYFIASAGAFCVTWRTDYRSGNSRNGVYFRDAVVAFNVVNGLDWPAAQPWSAYRAIYWLATRQRYCRPLTLTAVLTLGQAAFWQPV